jgi:acetaldehyde dehydrogenase/alcohol dehydrogenase
MPMLADMKTIMEAAYYGTSFHEVRAHRAAVAATADDAAAVDAAPVEAPVDAAPVEAPNGASPEDVVPVAAVSARRPRRNEG